MSLTVYTGWCFILLALFGKQIIQPKLKETFQEKKS